MAAICGADCGSCGMRERCRGCAETEGRPFGDECVVYKCYKGGGEKSFYQYKNQLIEEFNALDIPDMPQITELFPLNGAYINLEYKLENGQRIKLLRDSDIYLGCQVEKPSSDRCYGLSADSGHLVVCEYGCGGSDPQIVIYKRRQPQADGPSA